MLERTPLAQAGTHHFDIDQGRKAGLLAGLDDIGETLQHSGDISAFEAQRKLTQPWLS